MTLTSLRAIDEVALSNPGQNAIFVPGARAAANAEVALLEECLVWIESESEEAQSIRRDIEAIKSLPGLAPASGCATTGEHDGLRD